MQNGDKLSFWFILWIVFIAEIPCLLRTMAIQVRNESIWQVVWGTTAGNLLALVVGITLAKIASSYLGPRGMEYMENVSAIALIALGFYLLLRHDHAH